MFFKCEYFIRILSNNHPWFCIKIYKYFTFENFLPQVETKCFISHTFRPDTDSGQTLYLYLLFFFFIFCHFWVFLPETLQIICTFRAQLCFHRLLSSFLLDLIYIYLFMWENFFSVLQIDLGLFIHSELITVCFKGDTSNDKNVQDN